MKVSLIAIVSCSALVAYAQTFINGVTTPNVSADNKEALLKPYTYPNIPVVDFQSTDLICRSPDLADPNVEPFKIAGGETITLRWDTKMKPGIGSSAISGPCSFWLAKASSKGTGPNWSKLNEFTYDGDAGKPDWCSYKLNRAGDNAYYEFKLPELVKGVYYLRAEIIDLNDAGKTNYDDFTMGSRSYASCLMIEITGDGTETLKKLVDIMDAYKPYYKSKVLLGGNIGNAKFVYPGPVAPQKGPTNSLLKP
ncbi:hypothetical protein GGI20_005138 [Coemansia sp. BCRC 34301]|nr:hypothetical protein GGI20_005138 [Coemansia sp. BCRC 34301]